MNKIKVVDNVVEELKITKKILFSIKPAKNEFDIATIKITLLKSCDMEFTIISNASKWQIDIESMENVDAHIYIYQQIEKSKVQYNYQVPQNSSVEVYKFQTVPAGKEMITSHLTGKGANFQHILKDICKGKETFDYYIYHDDKETTSNVKNNIVTIRDGKATVQVSTFVPKGKKASIANQSNRIINLNDKRNEVRPNLYIDEYDVVANHSALVGKFNGEEIFYLLSRGIPKQEASRLLLKGFLLSDITNKKMQKQIELATREEWR